MNFPFLSYPSRTVLLVLFSTLSLSAQAQPPTPTPVDYSGATENLTDYVREEMDKENIKGLSLALVDGNKVVWTRGFGYSDNEEKIHAEPDTLFRIGGLSRIFTALEILKLSQQGKLGLDRPLKRYLPAFSIHNRFKNAKSITLRSLLAQHSGLPCFFTKGMWEEDHQSLSQLVRDLKDDYLTAPPQTLYRYSYLDYDLAGRVIELKTGKPFAQAMREDLLAPLGLQDSTFILTPYLYRWLAKGYRGGKEQPDLFLRDVPMAGMVSSAQDLGRFLSILLGDGTTPEGVPFFKPDTLSALFEDQYPDLPLDFGLRTGLGWLLSGETIEGVDEVAWQEGSYPPYTSRTMVLPGEKIGVAVLSNSQEAQKAVSDICVWALKLMLKVKTGEGVTLEKPKVETPKPFPVPTATLDSYTGLYSAFGQATRIARKDNHLTGKFFDYQFDLIPIGEKLLMPRFNFLFFPIDFPQFPLELTEVDGTTIAVLRGLPFPIPLERITPAPIPQAWMDRLGSYSADNPDQQIQITEVSLQVKDGLLTVVSKLNIKPFDFKEDHLTTGLLPVSNDDAVIAGLFYGDGGTLHAVDDEEGTHIYYSGYWFTKKSVFPSTPTQGPTPVSRPGPGR